MLVSSANRTGEFRAVEGSELCFAELGQALRVSEINEL